MRARRFVRSSLRILFLWGHLRKSITPWDLRAARLVRLSGWGTCRESRLSIFAPISAAATVACALLEEQCASDCEARGCAMARRPSRIEGAVLGRDCWRRENRCGLRPETRPGLRFGE